jgi:hypothetical protein
VSWHATPCLHLFTLVAWGAILPSLDVSPSQPLQLVLLRVGLWGGGAKWVPQFVVRGGGSATVEGPKRVLHAPVWGCGGRVVGHTSFRCVGVIHYRDFV